MVTGGAAGFIGSRLVEKLVENGGLPCGLSLVTPPELSWACWQLCPQTILSQIELVRGGFARSQRGGKRYGRH